MTPAGLRSGSTGVRVRTDDGAALEVTVAGRRGAPVLTFSNSLMTDIRLWDAVTAELADDFFIVRYDMRGHGGSSAPAAPYAIDRLADDIVAIWDALSVARSHLIGLSIGGMTALGTALRAPSRVQSLTLLSMRADAPQPFRDSWEPRIAMARDDGMAALADATVDRWFPPTRLDDAARELTRAMIRATAVEGFVGGARAIQGLSYLDRAGSVAMPALLIAGSEDGVLPGAMRDLADVMPQARYVEMPGTGHLVSLEEPRVTAAQIRAFVLGQQEWPPARERNRVRSKNRGGEVAKRWKFFPSSIS